MDSTMTLVELMAQVATVAGYLWDRGWAERNGGNISVHIPDFQPSVEGGVDTETLVKYPHNHDYMNGQYLLISGTGTRMRDLARKPEECLAVLHFADDGSGYRRVYGGNRDWRPTSELSSHLYIHHSLRKSGKEGRAVVHTHPDELVALSHDRTLLGNDALNRVLWSMFPEVKVFIPEGVGLVPYALTGSRRLAELTVDSLQDHEVVLWEKHGCLATGVTPEAAFDSIDVLNKAARMYLLCKAAGFEPEGLSDDNIDELNRSFNL